MARYTTTPWRHQSDLLSVRSQLYSHDATLQRSAVNRIMTWKLRSNLPHAVESTALLVDAILHHHSSASNSDYSIRAVYAAAFTRFVTGFCDIGRNRERVLEPSSMLEIAGRIGMPASFVALRHEATHEELPSLQRLVGVVGEALGWLWSVYWERLEEPIAVVSGEGDMQGVREEVRRVLKEFRSARKEELKAKRTAVRGQELVQGTAGTIAELCTNRKEALAMVSGVCVDDKMLYPSDREMWASLNGAYMLWEELLLAICSRQTSFLPILVDAILNGLSSPSNIRPEHDAGKEALLQWLTRISSATLWQRRCQDIQFDEKSRMISHSCLHPGYWSHILGDGMLKESKNQDLKEMWSDLLAASALSPEDGLIGGGEIEVGGASQAKLKSNSASENAMSLDHEATGGWRLAVFTPRTPIGVVR